MKTDYKAGNNTFNNQLLELSVKNEMVKETLKQSNVT